MEINWKTGAAIIGGGIIGGWLGGKPGPCNGEKCNDCAPVEPVPAALYGTINLVANLALAWLIQSERGFGKDFAASPWYCSVAIGASSFYILTNITAMIANKMGASFVSLGRACRVTVMAGTGSFGALVLLGAATGKNPLRS